ncbi:MAG: metal ABC transporter substrate-binding protein [Pyrobaculum sp.]
MRRVFILVLVVALAAAALLFFFQSRPVETHKVRIGLLPVVDALPFVVAEKEGLFKDVELVYFGSARDRDSAIISGQIDVALHDPVGALMLIGRGAPIKIVGFICCTSPSDSNVGFYFVKAPGASSVKTVAVSKNTIIDYVASKLVNMSVEYVDVPSIANRFQLLLEGKVDAAVLPDPWGTLALRKNATLIAKYRDLVVLVARDDLLKTQEGRKALENIVAALNKAVDLYNSDPAKYQQLLAERLNIPRELGTYEIVWRSHISPLPRDIFEDAANWLVQKGLLANKPRYEDCVS